MGFTDADAALLKSEEAAGSPQIRLPINVFRLTPLPISSIKSRSRV
jgi:hypothetical protein